VASEGGRKTETRLQWLQAHNKEKRANSLTRFLGGEKEIKEPGTRTRGLKRRKDEKGCTGPAGAKRRRRESGGAKWFLRKREGRCLAGNRRCGARAKDKYWKDKTKTSPGLRRMVTRRKSERKSPLLDLEKRRLSSSQVIRNTESTRVSLREDEIGISDKSKFSRSKNLAGNGQKRE